MTSQGSLSVNHQETARRPAGWPSDKPVWSLRVFFLAGLMFGADQRTALARCIDGPLPGSVIAHSGRWKALNPRDHLQP